MSIWVKICGNTSLEDASLAVEAGADALGFVFASSPRQVTVDRVAAITPGLPASVEKIGVFVDSGFDQIETAVRVCGLSGVQLHRGGVDNLSTRLRERFGLGFRIVQVLHFHPDLASMAQALAGDQSIDAILVDSRTATAVGGTGVCYDWSAAESFFRSAGTRVIAAGGLTPENVAEAIRILKPWGVDVVSGVEAAPGRKDAEKVRRFIANARAAVVQ